ncbi:DUF1419 domain-containing protein [Mesorhizobium sp. M1163]|uniref:DUF1419 domain-containing protein n=1 Tax=Mesorhizobium sp. M1163 TaxID=2957065 RepID=UPI0033384D66
MTAHPPFRKVLDGVATREQMFQLFSRHKDTPGIDPLSGTPYSAEWFEITASEYHFMLDLLPPLFMRTGMFGMSEYKAGNVTSEFFAIRIRGRERWFHGFCDLTDRQSPDKMRAAIIAHETGASDSMTRSEARGDLEHNPCRTQGDRPQRRPRDRVGRTSRQTHDSHQRRKA